MNLNTFSITPKAFNVSDLGPFPSVYLAGRETPHTDKVGSL